MSGRRIRKSHSRKKPPSHVEHDDKDRRLHRRHSEVSRDEKHFPRSRRENRSRRMDVWEKDALGKVRDINPKILDPRITDVFSSPVHRRMENGRGRSPTLDRSAFCTVDDSRILGRDSRPPFEDRDNRRNEPVGSDSWYLGKQRNEDREFWEKRFPPNLDCQYSWDRRSPFRNHERGFRFLSPRRNVGSELWRRSPSLNDNNGYWERRSPSRDLTFGWNHRPLPRGFEETSWQQPTLQRDSRPSERFSRRDLSQTCHHRSRSRSGPSHSLSEGPGRLVPNACFLTQNRSSPPRICFSPPNSARRGEVRSEFFDRNESVTHSDVTRVEQQSFVQPLSGKEGITGYKQSADATLAIQQLSGTLNNYASGNESEQVSVGETGLSAAQMTRARELLEELLVTVSGQQPPSDSGLSGKASSSKMLPVAPPASFADSAARNSASHFEPSYGSGCRGFEKVPSMLSNEVLHDQSSFGRNSESVRKLYAQNEAKISPSRMSVIGSGLRTGPNFDADRSRGWRDLDRRDIVRSNTLLENLDRFEVVSKGKHLRNDSSEGTNALNISRKDLVSGRFVQSDSSHNSRRK